MERHLFVIYINFYSTNNCEKIVPFPKLSIPTYLPFNELSKISKTIFSFIFAIILPI